MVVRMKKPPPKKRKPGERAGLTRAKITAAATKFLVSHGHARFTIRALAKHLGVATATINSHFKGMDDLVETIVRTELEPLAPPLKFEHTPQDYLRILFRSAVTSFRAKPHIGRLAVYHLTDAPFFSPMFAERVCATLDALSKQEIARSFECFNKRLVALILTETGQTAIANPEAASEQLTQKLSALDAIEHPTLHQFANELSADYSKRAAPDYLQHQADKALAGLLSDLDLPSM